MHVTPLPRADAMRGNVAKRQVVAHAPSGVVHCCGDTTERHASESVAVSGHFPAEVSGRNRAGCMGAGVGRSSGLRTRTSLRRSTCCSSLPSHRRPVPMTSFVSVYRCGAAPVSHRIPISVRASPNTDERKIDASTGQVNTISCGKVATRSERYIQLFAPAQHRAQAERAWLLTLTGRVGSRRHRLRLCRQYGR